MLHLPFRAFQRLRYGPPPRPLVPRGRAYRRALAVTWALLAVSALVIAPILVVSLVSSPEAAGPLAGIAVVIAGAAILMRLLAAGIAPTPLVLSPYDHEG